MSAQPMEQIPKVDLHCHLEGAIRPETVLELHQENHTCYAGESLSALLPAIQVTGEESSLFDFLAKFEIIMPALKTEEDVVRITREAVQDAAHDGVIYLELRFAPHFIADYSGLSAQATAEAVHAGARQAEEAFGLPVELIVIIPQYGGREVAAETVEIAIESFAGVDIAGDIRQIGLDLYAPELTRAAESGLGVTIHAAEVTPADTIVTAVNQLHATRIGHGIRAVDDPAVVELVKEREVLLEVCLSSNLQTRAAESIEAHPVHQLLEAGAWVSLNSDDPAISNITLSDEYRLAEKHLGLTRGDLLGMDYRAMQAAFTGDERRQAVQAQLKAALTLTSKGSE